MFKVKNNLLPIGIQSLFTINSNSYNTRQSGKFNQKYVRTTIKSITVSVAGVNYGILSKLILQPLRKFVYCHSLGFICHVGLCYQLHTGL